MQCQNSHQKLASAAHNDKNEKNCTKWKQKCSAITARNYDHQII